MKNYLIFMFIFGCTFLLLKEYNSIKSNADGAYTGSSYSPSIDPVRPNARKAKVTSEFGPRRGKPHKGRDYAGPRGTPIIATADGIIDKIAYDADGYGWYVRINHGHGLQTLYANLNSKPPVKLRDRVKRGEKIGEMGNTGRTTGTHLHYEVIKNGERVDPRHYILATKLEKVVIDPEDESIPVVKVEKVVIDPEDESIPIDEKKIKITMTKEVNGIKVDGQPATGAGKEWHIELEKLKLENKVGAFGYPSFVGFGTIRLTIEWTNKDDTTGTGNITGSAMIEGTYNEKNDTMERKLISVSFF